MGKRSTSRRLAMQALYQADHANIGIKEALDKIFEDEKFIDETKEFSSKIAIETWGNKKELDVLIEKYSKEWKIERMGGVDRNILRMAIYELRQNEVPDQVIINEAVELAKKYSSPEAAKFVNGILGAYKKDLDK